jgi:hypothetical protein
MTLRQLGEPFDSYDGLVGLIRFRLDELSVTCEAASALAGLTETHVSKLVNPARTRVLGSMSFSVLLQVLGLRLVALVDDEAYAPLRARLPQATFNRWGRPREMRVRVGDVGGVAAVEKVPALHAAVTAPIAEKPKPAAPPAKSSPTVVLRPKIPSRGFSFGRGHRKASRPSAGAAA